MQAWSRLVRFQPVGSNTVLYGQLIDNSVDPGLASQSGDSFQVYEVSGTDPLYNGVVNETKIHTVGTLLCPLTEDDIDVIRCLGTNYKEHVKEAGRAAPEVPVMFIKPKTALAGPGTISIPPCVHADPKRQEPGESAGQLDFETELALVLKEDVKDVSKEDAMSKVLGYTCANDLSARYHQRRQHQWNFGKGFDGFSPLGPVLVSPSALEDPQKLAFEGRLNGKLMQQSNTGDMLFPIAESIAFLSQGTTLKKGSVLLMGTPSGVGIFRNPREMLQDGDTFTVWHEGIGTLVNTMHYV